MWEKVVSILESAEDYKAVVLPDDFGLVPYGKCGYQSRLVAVIDVDQPVHLVLAEVLTRAGNWCKDIVKNVLIYVDCDREVWVKYWKVFEPSFSMLMVNLDLNIEIVFADEVLKVVGQ